MDQKSLDNSNDFISLSEASKITGYHQDYLGFLCRQGKLVGFKIGRNWVTTKNDLDSFLANYKNGINEVTDESGKTIPVHVINTSPKIEALEQVVTTSEVLNGSTEKESEPINQSETSQILASSQLSNLKSEVLLGIEKRVEALGGSLQKLEAEADKISRTSSQSEAAGIIPVATNLKEKFSSNFPVDDISFDSTSQNSVINNDSSAVSSDKIKAIYESFQTKVPSIIPGVLASSLIAVVGILGSYFIFRSLDLNPIYPITKLENSKTPDTTFQITPNGNQLPNQNQNNSSGNIVYQVTGGKTVINKILGYDQSELYSAIDTRLEQYLAEGKFKGPKGDTGASGANTIQGGITVIQPNPANNFPGATISAVTDFSANNGSFNNLFATNFTASGQSVFNGNTTFNSNTNLNGTTTISNLVSANLNLGFTNGSVIFQGTGGLAQDNSNFFYNASTSQLSLGTSTPNSSALLELDSTSKGFLAPRMTQLQINAIASPAQGLLVFNTDTQSYNFYNGSSWQPVGTGTGGSGGVATGTPGSFAFYPAASQLVTPQNLLFISGSNIGIGSSAPTSELTIQATGTPTNLFQITSTTGASLVVVDNQGNLNLASNLAVSKNLSITGNEIIFGNATTTGNQNIVGNLSVAGQTNFVNASGSSESLTGSLLIAGNSLNPFQVNSSTGATLLTALGNGNVGIGTNNPGAKLEVSNGVDGLQIIPGNPIRIAGSGCEEIDLYAIHATCINNTYIGGMALLNNGNIGIGTSSPTQALSVIGNIQLTGALFDSTNASGTSGQILQTTSTGTQWVATSTLGFASASSFNGINGYVARWASASGLTSGSFLDNGTVSGVNATSSTTNFLIQGTGSNNPFQINSSTGSSLVTVLPNGNVGVGTTTPNALFDITRNTAAQDNSDLLTVQNFSQSAFPFAGLNTNVNNANGGGYINFRVNGNTEAALEYWGTTNGNAGLDLNNTQNSPIRLSTNNIERLRITGAGNVGIGTAAPTSTLFVQGAGAVNPFSVVSSTGNSLLTVLANGNVGIGTSTPGNKLTIEDGGFTGLRMFAAGSSPNNGGIFIGAGNDNVGLMMAGGEYNSTGFVARATSATDLFFTGGYTQIRSNSGLTPGSSYSPQPRLTVDPNGNVGIANANPTYVLDVSPTSAVSNNLFRVAASTGAGLYVLNNGNVGVGTTTPISPLTVIGNFDLGSSTNGSTMRFSQTNNVLNLTSVTPGAAANTTVNIVPGLTGAAVGFNLFSAPNATGTQFGFQSNDFTHQSFIYSSGIGEPTNPIVIETKGASSLQNRLTFNADSDISTILFSNSNVGINTTSSTVNLLVQGTVSNIPFQINSSSGSSLLIVDSTGRLTAQNLTLAGVTGLTQCLHVDSSGKVTGTGTDCGSAAGGTLAGGTKGYVAVWASSTGLTVGTLLDNGTVSGVNATSSTINFLVQGTGTNNPFQINSSTGASLVTVLPNGNVGIGTTTANSRVYIQGGGFNTNAGESNVGNYALAAQSIAADASIYSYGSICAQTSIGNCTGTGGVVLGNTNTAALINLPVSGNIIFNNGGNVGIGTTTPQAPLVVNRGSGTVNQILDTNATSSSSELDFARGGNVNYGIYNYFADNSFRIWDYASSTDRLIIKNGNVGVGISFTPTATLSVQGTGGSTNPFQVNSSTGNSLLNVLANGNVGIGTTTPSQALEASGTIQADTGFLAGIGSASNPSYSFFGQTNLGIFNTGGNLGFVQGGNVSINLSNSTNGLRLSNNIGLNWTPGVSNATAPDTGLSRFVAGVVAVGNGINGNATGTLIAGNVGIGSSSPASTLTVASSLNCNNAPIINITDASGTPLITATKDCASNPRIVLNNANPLTLTPSALTSGGAFTLTSFNPSIVGVGNAAALTVKSTNAGFDLLDLKDSSGNIRSVFNSSGNLGVGSTVPTSVLSVQGTSSAPSISLLTLASSTGSSLFEINSSGAELHNGIAGIVGQILQSNGTSTAPTWISTSTFASSIGSFVQGGNSFGAAAILGTNDNNALNFETNSSTKMTILANGNVGIGSTSPSALLTVQGTGSNYTNIDNSGAITSTGNIFTTNGIVRAGNMALNSGGSTLDSFTGNILIGSSSARQTQVFGPLSVGLNGNLGYTLGVQGIAGATNPFNVASSSGTSELMVANNGNVGIGTTTPGYALDVESGDMFVRNGAGASNGKIHFPTNGNDVYVGSSANQLFINAGSYNLNLGNKNNNAYAILTQTGQFAIGTSSPSNLLSVYGSASIGQGYEGITAPTNGLIVAGNVGIGTATPQGILVVGNNIIYASSTTGYVGIDKANPAYPLDVSGSANISSVLTVAGGTINLGGGVLSNASTQTNIYGFGGVNLQYYNGSAITTGLTVNGSGNTIINGNLGINTTTPTQKLVVAGNEQLTGALFDSTNASGTNGQILQSTGTGVQWVSSSTIATTLGAFVQGGNTFGAAAILGTNDNNALNFETNSSTKMTILANGNVGIGTTSPSQKLYVSGGKIEVDNAQGLYARNSANTADYRLIDLDSSNVMNIGPNGSVQVQTGATTGLLYLSQSQRIGILNNSPQYTLDIKANGNDNPFNIASSSGTSYLTVTNLGNVGIGTTSPSQMLTVGNNNQFTVSSAGVILSQGTSASQFRIKNLTNNSTVFNVNVDGTSGGALAGVYAVSGQTTPYFQVGTTNNNGQVFEIEQNGNVGIGTTTPATKLAIFGLAGPTDGITIGDTTNNVGSRNWVIANAAGPNYGSLDFLVGGSVGTTPNLTSNIAMTLQSSGNLGIGTATPSSKLTIQGSGITSATAAETTYNASGTLLTTILNNGNVGIGTGTPDKALTVFSGVTNQRTGISDNGIFFSRTSDGSYVADISHNGSDTLTFDSRTKQIFNTNSIQGSVIALTNGNAISKTLFGVGTPSDSSSLVTVNGALSVGYTNASTTNGLLVSGNIGVGTTTPTQKLVVVGNEQLTGALFDSNNASGTNGMILQTTGTGTQWVATSTLGFGAGNTTGTGSNGYVARWTSSTALATSTILDNGIVSGVNATSSTTSFLVQGTGSLNPFQVNSSTGTSLLTVLANGNVGIGGNPNGVFQVTRGTGDQTAWAYFSNNVGATVPQSVQGLNMGWNMTSGGGEYNFVSNRGGGNTGGFRFGDYNGVGVTNLMTILGNGDVGVGTTVPTSALAIAFDASTTASSTLFTIASTSPVLQLGRNSLVSPSGSGTYLGMNAPTNFGGDLLNIQQNGTTYLKVQGNNGLAGIGVSTITSLNSNGILMSPTVTSQNSNGIQIVDQSNFITSTSGTNRLLTVGRPNSITDTVFQPASGSAVFNVLEIDPAINQTNTASGITRGQYINPILNGVADYRNIETAATTTTLTSQDNISTAYNILFNPLTYSSASTSLYNLANASTLNIAGAPKGTSASTTIASSTGITIQGNALTNVTNGYGLYVTAPSGASNNFAALFNGNVGINSATSTTSFLVQGTGSNNPFQVNSSTGTSLLTVLANGNVGIGTATPTSKLTIAAIPYAASQEGGIRLQSTGGEHYGLIDIATDSGGTPRLAIHPPAFGGTTETFSIGNTGNVGINSTSPYSMLVIQGNSVQPTFPVLSVTSSTGTSLLTVLENGNVGIGTAAPAAPLEVYNAGNSYIGIHSLSSYSTIDMISASVANIGYNGIFQIGTTGSIGAAISPKLTIDNAGNVGIGTTTPSSALQVVGNITNLTTSNSPIGQIGSVGFGSTPQYVYVSGRYAYVINSGLSIVDISKPSAPVEIASTTVGSTPASVYVSGRYAYVANSASNNISIVDISNPTSPSQISTASVGNTPNSIAVSGHYAYVVNGNSNSISVVDISNPYLPTQVATTSVGSSPIGISISGRYLYTVNFSTNNLSVVDISNPLAPVQVGTATVGSGPEGLYVSGRYAYVANYNSSNMSVVDISNPSSPTQVATSTLGGNPRSVYVAGRYAYIANASSGTLSVVDISNPTAPSQITTAITGFFPWSVYVSGHYAYVVNLSSSNLVVVDINGTETSSLAAGSAEIGNLQVRNDIITQGQLQVQGGLNVGSGGILSSGALAIMATSTPSYIGGNLGVGTSTPAYALDIYHAGSNAVLRVQSSNSFAELYLDSGSIASSNSNIKFKSQGVGLFEMGTDPTGFYFNNHAAVGNPGSAIYIASSTNNVGIDNTNPSQTLSVNGNMQLTGALFDSTNASGTNGMILQTTGTGTKWVATSTLAISGSVSGGTNGYVTRWTSASSLSSGTLIDNGTVAGVNATSSVTSFLVQGAAGLNPFRVNSSTGTSLLTVLANGNVGIGTATPISAFAVQGNSPTITLAQTNGVNQNWQIRSGSGGIGSRTLDIYDQTASATRMLIDQYGQVMFGTSTNNIPGNNSRMFVYGGNFGANIDVMGDASIVGGDQAVIEMEGSDYGANSDSARLQFYGPSALGSTAGFTNQRLGVLAFSNNSTAIIETSGTTTPLIIATNDTERMRIMGNGNIGINTTAPSAMLMLQSAGTSEDLVRIASTTGTNMIQITPYGGFVENIASTTAFNIQDGSGNSVFNIDSTQSASNSGLDITAGGSQIGNLLNFYSSGGTQLLAVTSVGGISQNISSTTALQIQNGSGVNVFSVNTVNGVVNIATSASSSIASILTSDGNFTIGDDGLVGSTDGRIWIRSRGTTFRFNSTGNTADYSEFFYQDSTSTPDVGTVMVLENKAIASSSDSGIVQFATSSYQSNLVGVVTNRGTGNNNPNDDRQFGGHWVNVGMLGHIPVKVTNENGSIHAGDFLTSSNKFHGYAMKADRSGVVIGQALADYDPLASSTLISGINSTSSAIGGLVLTYVHPGYQVINNTFVLGDYQANQLTGATGNLPTTSPASFIIDQQGSGNLLQLQQNEQNRLLVGPSGSVQILANIQNTGDVLTVTNASTTLFAISSVGDAKFTGHILVGKDTAGTAVVKAGDNQTTVTFTTPYNSVPKVIASPNGVPVLFAVTNKTVNGFTIITNQPAGQDVSFDWFVVEQPDSTNSVSGSSLTVAPPQNNPSPVIPPTPTPTDAGQGAPQQNSGSSTGTSTPPVEPSATPSPTPTASATPEVSSTPAPTPTPTATPSPTPTADVTPTP